MKKQLLGLAATSLLVMTPTLPTRAESVGCPIIGRPMTVESARQYVTEASQEVMVTTGEISSWVSYVMSGISAIERGEYGIAQQRFSQAALLGKGSKLFYIGQALLVSTERALANAGDQTPYACWGSNMVLWLQTSQML